MENEQELINKNLQLINNSKSRFSRYQLVNLKGKTSHGGFIKEMLIVLNNYNLIIESGDYISLSKFGKEIIDKYGNWNNYLNQESIKERKEEIRQNKKDFILNIDSKWKIPYIIISILLFLGTFYFGFNEINSKENKGNIESQKEQIIDTTSIKELKKEAKLQEKSKDTTEFQIKDSK